MESLILKFSVNYIISKFLCDHNKLKIKECLPINVPERQAVMHENIV